MASLTNSIDRLSEIAKSIRTTASSISAAPAAGPFTRAVLHTHLGDLIRDADPSEVGLFTLVQPARPDSDNVGAKVKEVTRVEFTGATPLRKPTGRYGAKTKEREPEPEVYAQAALKYLDRYQHIRPMPRARAQVLSLLEELSSLRESISELESAFTLQSASGPNEPPMSPKSMTAAEERRIQEIQRQMVELKQQKESLLQAQAAPRKRAFPARNPPTKPPQTSAPKADAQEDMFWNTPASRGRTLHFTESLMDESVDLANVTTTFSGPLEAPASKGKSRDLAEEDESEEDDEEGEEDAEESGVAETEETSGELEDDVNQTVVLPKQPEDEPKSPIRPPDTSASDRTVELAPQTPSQSAPTGTAESARKPKVRITTEVERVVVKIWATVGELIMPGHPYTAPNKPPRAKETLAHLQSLSSLPPEPTSPISLSTLSALPTQPTTHQILTARLLLALLSAPSLKAPLNQLKEAVSGTPDPALGMRALYGLVAKRLIRIDRSTREQTVVFDV
ncbi:hypothetical protein NEOLEDRAFT_1167693 [Neolentinus lepideus HHB14362 ss-1]|uniref:Uncharacterized protein n=1 Tax=Neolentinus lepideus HHB14362 ss-1 TaxID=1314782 RepID=A0A165UD56_9AGAM|nr:hypothetical protein NEOLEDRAFT_1167693 [Neolentinus lepideus HHB14362 ss-1]